MTTEPVDTTSPMSPAPGPQPSAQISVLASGALLLNGLPSDMEAIRAELLRLKAVNGAVWYYREVLQTKAAANPLAEQLFDMILEHRLPITRSTTPDFSDYVDNQGQSHPLIRAQDVVEVATACIEKRVRSVRLRWAMLAAVLGLVVAACQMPSYLAATDMLAHGMATDARVLQKKHWVETGPNRKQFDHDTVVYEFTDGTGTRFENEVSYNPNSATPIHEGDAISILYERQTPDTNGRRAQYQHEASLQNIVEGALLAAGFVGAIGYFIGFLVRRKLRAELKATPVSVEQTQWRT